MTPTKKVVIVPCSGIGKSFGTVSRMAAYHVTEDDCPENTKLLPLSLLVLGDAETRSALDKSPAITLDGCQLACATKMVRECGGKIAKDFSILDVFRRYRDFKPQGITELNEGGQKLAKALAAEIDAVVDQLTEKEKGGKLA
jgi:uncharacterized metal-binding protein